MAIRPGGMLEYQLTLTEHISKKIQEASITVPVLGVIIGEDRWLVPMHHIGEVLPVPKITPVFLTHSWFLGVINVRGDLYGVCDLARYLGGIPTQTGVKNRIFLIASCLGVNCAILTSGMLGIRNLLEFTRQSDCQDSDSIVAGIYNDRQGKTWRILNLPVLVRLESFLQIAE